LVFDPTGYALLGVSLFLGILCALAISLILGSLAQGVSNIQAVTAPIIALVMIPYIFTLFLDFTKLTPWVKYLVYAIPFSHPFLAAQNILFHRYTQVVYGIAYELFVFAVFVYIASKLFTSDRILTMRLNFGKKRPSESRA
jgi:ABC-2 type transport system permease protein